MLAALLSHPIVWGTSITELVMVIAIIPLVAGLYRMVECHQDGCHRLGRFRHGHFKLCHIHHPNVPSDGKVTAEHIAAVDATPHASSLLEEVHYLAHTGKPLPRVENRLRSKKPITPIKTPSVK